MKLVLFLLSSYLILMASIPTQAVKFRVLNNATGTPGGVRFGNEIGDLYAERILKNASAFIWRTFQQGERERKDVEEVTLTVQINEWIADTEGDKITLDAGYVGNYSGDVKLEVTGILYHEATHVWQWSGNDQTPSGLIEGIADYVRLKAGLAPAHWAKKGSGNQWDAGYTVTAYFLDYCDELKNGFVASLNDMMKDSYSDEFFVLLLGKTVDQLWKDYKRLYGSM